MVGSEDRDAAGSVEIAFDGPPERFGVGVHRTPPRPAAAPPPLPDPLFVFRR